MCLSKKQIAKLGKRLSESEGEVCDLDLTMLQEYRKSFKAPLSDVFDQLKKMSIKIDSKSIVTYRIKRIDTIINKLRRFSKNVNGRMSLDNIGDIAGCRCILHNENQIYRLKDLLIKHYKSNIDYSDKHDYIKNPQESGYRSLHLYVKHPKYKRKVEIQLRTIEHHDWATLVEIIDLIFGTKIKEGTKDENQLKYFLQLFSRKENLDTREIKELIKIEQQNKIYKKISIVFRNNYLNVRKAWLSRQKKGCYYVIEANNITKTSFIENFSNYDEAENVYYDKYVGNRESNIVLTYLLDANFTQLSKAYANYILTVHTFFDDYRAFIENNVLEALQKENLLKLIKDLNLYRSITVLYVSNLKYDINMLQNYSSGDNGDKNRLIKWQQELEIEISNGKKCVKRFIMRVRQSMSYNRWSYFIVKIEFYLLNRKIK